MKTIVVIATLLFSAAAHAGCVDEIMEKAAQLQAEAVRQGMPLALTSFKVEALPDGIDGITYRDLSVVVDPAKICNRPAILRNSIIAHEFGHVIAFNIYPDRLAYYRAGGKDLSVDETLANMYGARLLDGTERVELVAVMDDKCTSGVKDYCWRRDAWQYGMTH